MVARGLKSKIAINVATLLLLSALVTDILIVVVTQTIMTRNAVAKSQGVMEHLGSVYFSSVSDADNPAAAPNYADPLLETFKDQFSALGVWNKAGRQLFLHQVPPYSLSLSQAQIDTALATEAPKIKDLGMTWSIFWWHSSATSITVPVLRQGEVVGVIAAIVSFNPLLDQLRGYHRAILLYIVINTCILTVIGLYRIFRLYLSPIDRIVLQADHFNDDDDPFFAFRQEDNELNRLSLSLNRMLARISSDKKKLHQTVSSLETANRELQLAQREIIKAEKLASVGRLAAGIAHEIGNPIGIVFGYLDLLKHDDLSETEMDDFLKRIEMEVQRINSIIRQLLDLARTKEIKPRPMALHPVIEDIIKVMAVQPLTTDIDIQAMLEADKDVIWGNEDQLRQVFLNLLLNAADAIRSGPDPASGAIVITTANLDKGGGSPSIDIIVSDNGPGIEAQQLENIFDPFFTTKEPGKGTGLGLAVSYMIIDGLGGRISASRLAQGGAAFTISLRCADAGSTATQQAETVD